LHSAHAYIAGSYRKMNLRKLVIY